MNKVKLANWLLSLILIAFFIYSQGPAIINNFKKEGVKLADYRFISLSDELVSFPPREGKVTLIYWATWCGPCKVEMRRLQRAVESGEIEAENIYAYSPFEERKVILKFLEKEPFSFQFIQDRGELARKLELRMTPSIAHIENREVKYLGTGISPLLIWRIKNFYRRY